MIKLDTAAYLQVTAPPFPFLLIYSTPVQRPSDIATRKVSDSRRRHDEAAAERVRLSETLRDIQTKLAYHQAWTAVESPAVGQAYAELVQQMRHTAGAAMHQAWQTPAITSDDAMNIPSSVIDLSSLKPYERAYLDAVRSHLTSLSPWWVK